ncbi:serpentine type 7TM GPCR chemoreceptor srt domain-containing protein [Ditylenchus destructor]|uniref:Serpentine type 7TM GPCR chemoreceptor srt domain-containing protein n=1 Tax=Ditylenchus destructor TaxID=166010 RepID=A0AAD4N4X4_9BILA|nr:serpentine type 7TM GPCR chemoreceptor srt domain-containing protein [Ditylenchus destructor]
MDTYTFDKAAYDLHYNCSFYDVDSIPLEQRKHTVLGWMFIIFFVVTEMIYIPCIFAIWKHLEQSTYKFMFFLGLIDVFGMWSSGFFTGYFGITGQVFCSNPRLIYILGMMAHFAWGNESATAIMLALNRCIDILSPTWGKTLYDGKRCWLWLIFPLSYGTYFAFFTKPVTFSSLLMSWFFNPHVGYFDDKDGTYINWCNTIYNWFVVIALPGLYITFVVLFAARLLRMSSYSAVIRRNRTEIKSFLQVLIITTANVFSSGIFDYMQLFETSPGIIYLGQVAWFTAHAAPPYIYWTLNKTIRRDCIRMARRILGMRLDKVSVQSNTGKISPVNTKTVDNMNTTPTANVNVKTMDSGSANPLDNATIDNYVQTQ